MVYPTQARAAERLGMDGASMADDIDLVEAAFEARLASCPEPEQPYLLAGYANVFRNRAELSAPST